MNTQLVEMRVDADVIAKNKCWAKNGEWCPVATAMTTALGRRVVVGLTVWRYHDHGTCAFHPLPAIVTAAINRLMDTGEMEPFTFEVELPT